MPNRNANRKRDRGSMGTITLLPALFALAAPWGTIAGAQGAAGPRYIGSDPAPGRFLHSGTGPRLHHLLGAIGGRSWPRCAAPGCATTSSTTRRGLIWTSRCPTCSLRSASRPSSVRPAAGCTRGFSGRRDATAAARAGRWTRSSVSKALSRFLCRRRDRDPFSETGNCEQLEMLFARTRDGEVASGLP